MLPIISLIQASLLLGRLSIGLSILSFPLLLPFIISSFYVPDENEGIPNEVLWARERKLDSELIPAPPSEVHVGLHQADVTLSIRGTFTDIRSFINGNLRVWRSEET